MDFRMMLLLATALGFVVTIGGLVAAWRGAEREYRDAERRIETMERLSQAEKDENAELMRQEEAGLIPRRTSESSADRHAWWEGEYRRNDIIRPTLGNLAFVAAYESRRLLGLVLGSTRRDFLVAAVGLLISTAASIGSLFLNG